MRRDASVDLIGARVPRVEDPRLLAGRGAYVDDLQLPGMLQLDILRSPHAHARICELDVSMARALPGVVAVYTGRDLAQFLKPVPSAGGMQGFNAPPHHVLAVDRVRFVGEGVAAVLAQDRYIARDARELINVTYDVLSAVTDPGVALTPQAPVLHDDIGSNRAFELRIGNDTQAALAASERIISGRFINQRVIPGPMETRGAVAHFEPWEGRLTVWLSTQAPHLMKREFARYLDFPEHRLRVVAPDVGGAFGAKNNPYAEELLAAALSLKHGVPLKWIEERSEHMLATSHARAQAVEVHAGVRADGTVQALHYRLTADMGAYYHAITHIGPMMTAALMTGAYRIAHAATDIISVFTNATPTDPYRGFGRAEATYFIERTMDLIARELGLDVLEVRRRNLIRPEEFPCTTPTGHVHESGNFQLCLDRALERFDYEGTRQEQARLRAAGRYLGIGIATHAWRAGFPSVPGGKGYVTSGWEKSTVSIDAAGKIRVVIGTSPHGQGVVTTTAQIVAQQFGMLPQDVRVIHGDTDAVAQGNGTMGSRSLVVGGSATLLAAQQVRAKAIRLAAHLLQIDPRQVVLESACFRDAGNSQRGIALTEVAAHAFAGPRDLPDGMEPCLEATVLFEPANFTTCFGAHVCAVEVDVQTGAAAIRRYIAIDDAGRAINPTLVEGQIHGGLAQGIGQALMEGASYDAAGQPLAASLLDYATPKASDLPHFEVELTETPSTVNPLGARGIGEAGAIGAPAAVVNAVLDALAPLGVQHLDMPLTPQRVWRAIQEARA